MVKHYVGARYVPKFASPVEWASNTSYEALTIVTFNNDSYTSKVSVPPTVGNPANNPQYWALTGNYNAQVEQYRQETETANNILQGNINSEAATRASADSNLQSQINQMLEKMVSNAYIMGRTGKVWKRKIWKASVNGTDACPALDDYGEGAATPFTDETAGNDPYMDSYTVFQWMYCNYTRDDDETARLKTLEGYPDFALTGAVEVGCIHPTFWWKQEEHGDYFELYFSDSPHEELGLIPWRDAGKSDGTVLPYFIVSAFPSVTASDGYPRSQPGKPVNNQSYDNIITNYAKKGTGYQGAGASINTLAMIYLIVKYQTKLEQTKFSGNNSFYTSIPIALAESDVKRALIASTDNTFHVHDGICISTSKDAHWLNGSPVAWAEITSIETVTIDGTSYKALNLDVSSTFTTTTAMYVNGSACPSGQTMRVMGHYDGSYISNTDNHHSFRIEGIELMNGLWHVFSDTVIDFLKDSWQVYVAPKGTKHIADAHTNYKMIGYSDAFTGDSPVGDIVMDSQTGGFYHSATTDSTAKGYGAYHWNGGTGISDGTLREWLGWGGLNNGAGDGLAYGFGWYALSDADASFGSRD